jgi:hypothetical protein
LHELLSEEASVRLYKQVNAQDEARHSMEYERPQQYNSSDRSQRKKVPDPQPDAVGSPMLKQGRLSINIANIPAYSSSRGSTLEQSLQSGGVNSDIPDSTTLPDSATLIAQAQAGLIFFGPVGIGVAVGITGAIALSIWVNTPEGQQLIGKITDIVGRGINSTLEELGRILERAGGEAVEQAARIEEFIFDHFFPIDGDNIRGNAEQLAIHLARLLRLSEVGGEPPDEDPDPGNDNDNHWWKEIKTFVKNILKASKGASRRQVFRELMKRSKGKGGYTEEQILDMERRLVEAAAKMGESIGNVFPP